MKKKKKKKRKKEKKKRKHDNIQISIKFYIYIKHNKVNDETNTMIPCRLARVHTLCNLQALKGLVHTVKHHVTECLILNKNNEKLLINGFWFKKKCIERERVK
jgi:hypothetical protein